MIERAIKIKVAKSGVCIFCDEDGTKLFGIVDVSIERPDGYRCKFFRICDKHLHIINKLLDGSRDIDKIFDTYSIETGRSVNLRAIP